MIWWQIPCPYGAGVQQCSTYCASLSWFHSLLEFSVGKFAGISQIVPFQ